MHVFADIQSPEEGIGVGSPAAEVIGSFALRPELGSSARAVRALNHQSIAPALDSFLLTSTVLGLGRYRICGIYIKLQSRIKTADTFPGFYLEYTPTCF